MLSKRHFYKKWRFCFHTQNSLPRELKPPVIRNLNT